MNNPALIAFLVEWIKRYGQKSPKFYKWLNAIGVAAMVITGLPEVLSWLKIDIGIHFNDVLEKVIFYCGLVTSIISLSTVQNSTTVVTDPTSAIKTVVVKEQLPFTAKAEAKKAEADPLTNVVTSSEPVITPSDPQV